MTPCSCGSAALNPDDELPRLPIRTRRSRGIRLRDTAQTQDRPARHRWCLGRTPLLVRVE